MKLDSQPYAIRCCPIHAPDGPSGSGPGPRPMAESEGSCNEELHGKTKSEQSHKLLQRQKNTISKLLSMKNKCLARDHFLFPSNSSSLMEETSTTKLANWIATRTQLIKMSIQQALKIDTQNTNPLTKWFAPQDAPTKPQRMQWHRNRLLHDPFNKKKRHKDDRTSTSHSRKSTYQTKLTDHLI